MKILLDVTGLLEVQNNTYVTFYTTYKHTHVTKWVKLQGAT